MSHPVDLLRRELAAEPSRPLVTFYDDATGERVELSVKTFDNWVAKTANLLVDGLGVDAGARVALALPLHWQTAVWLYACWAAGLTALPVDDGEIRWVAEGIPDLHAAVLPRADVTFTDGWHVQGLKGTGSYDYNVQDVFVPAYRTFPLFTREPFRGDSPALHMGLMPITAAGHAGWALGVAKTMLDDVEELAASKVRMGDMSLLASRLSFQKGLAHHVAMWRAARLLVLDAFEAAESAVAAGEELTPMLRADMRIAAVYATDASRECAQWAHLAAGTTAIREGSRLERAFRDMYTGTQHAFIGEKVATDAAQVWLGIVEDQRGL